MIFLRRSIPKLQERIKQRGRDYEQHITRDYLKELNDAYNHFFYHYNRSPLITINASEIDFVNNEEHLSYIERQIFEMPLHTNTHIHIAP
jgi:deoxyadenosine/deoxycytidine kinase